MEIRRELTELISYKTDEIILNSLYFNLVKMSFCLFDIKVWRGKKEGGKKKRDKLKTLNSQGILFSSGSTL